LNVFGAPAKNHEGRATTYDACLPSAQSLRWCLGRSPTLLRKKNIDSWPQDGPKDFSLPAYRMRMPCCRNVQNRTGFSFRFTNHFMDLAICDLQRANILQTGGQRCTVVKLKCCRCLAPILLVLNLTNSTAFGKINSVCTWGEDCCEDCVS
jgi:hypothetical protein